MTPSTFSTESIFVLSREHTHVVLTVTTSALYASMVVLDGIRQEREIQPYYPDGRPTKRLAIRS